MNSRQKFWYSMWIIVFTGLLIAAYINGFRISRAILNPRSGAATMCALMSSACVMMGARQLSIAIFKRHDRLSYLCLGGFLFNSLVLFGFVYLVRLLARIFLSPNVQRALHPDQMQFLVPAFAILLIILVNLPFVVLTRQHRVGGYSCNRYSSPPQRRATTPRTNIGTKSTSISYAVTRLGRGLSKGIGLLKRK